MTIFQSIILGIIQGLTEFLPISSSGHLVLAHNLLGWQETGLAFDVALHLGTLVALISFFFKDWMKIIRESFLNPKNWRKTKPLLTTHYSLLIYLVIGTIPAAVVGFFAEDVIETVFRSSWIVIFMLVGIGVLFILAEKVAKKQKDLGQINLFDSIIIGFAQALALIPGVSRSGITITAGLLRNIKREQAARFSFLLATPIISGAGLKKMYQVFKLGFSSDQQIIYLVGFLTSCIVGFITIKYLLKFLQNHKLNIFAYYRFVLAFIALLILILR
jgi:undecaprenyl-diphosphatase